MQAADSRRQVVAFTRRPLSFPRPGVAALKPGQQPLSEISHRKHRERGEKQKSLDKR
jgi:hypothetical protein